MIYNLNKLCIQSHLLQFLNPRGANLDKPLFFTYFQFALKLNPSYVKSCVTLVKPRPTTSTRCCILGHKPL